MSLCEFLLNDGSTTTGTTDTKFEAKSNIQNELQWGMKYRNYKQKEKYKPITPMHSPINIPFELCRAEQLFGRKKTMRSMSAPGTTRSKPDKGKLPKGKLSKSKKPKVTDKQKPTLLERSIWTQDEYMDYLSTPNPKFDQQPERRTYKKVCVLEPCPPRFIQLAVPNKRRVFANWKDYQDLLPTEMIMRYDDILHTDLNLEPTAARYYYKKLDKEKRKARKKMQQRKKKVKQAQQQSPEWLKKEIDKLVKDIVKYLKDEPLLTLNYKQMLLSDGILDRLERNKAMKKPSRKTKDDYRKTIIEISDKMGVWIDTLTRFVDVQQIESDIDIPPLSMPSLLGEDEDLSSFYESSEDDVDEEKDDEGEDEDELMAEWGEAADEGMDLQIKESGKVAFDSLFNIQVGEDHDNADIIFGQLDDDIMQKLINILSKCSDDFLNTPIDPDGMPEVTYRDVLNKLKALKQAMEALDGKPTLEQKLIDWAVQNDPDNVDDKILEKIHEVSGCLGEWFVHKPPGQSDFEETTDGEEEGATETGEGGVTSETGEGVVGEETGEGGITTETGEGGVAQVTGEGEAAAGTDEGAGTEEEAPAIPGEDDASPITGEKSAAAITGEEGSPDGTETGKDTDIAEAGDEKVIAVTEVDEGEEAAGDEGEDGKIYEGSPEDMADSLEKELKQMGGLGEEGLFIGKDLDVAGLYMEEEGFPGVEGPIFGPAKSEREITKEAEKAAGRIIKGHKPPKVIEHSDDTICCLALKTWAFWLLEITRNAQTWTHWMAEVINQVRNFTAIVRGDVKDLSGKPQMLKKAEWRRFCAETEQSVIAWRQYNAHVKELSNQIMDHAHNKTVNCCPKCLEDQLIPDVVTAHHTLHALTDAIHCASYWQKCLDNMVQRTVDLTRLDTLAEEEEEGESSDDEAILEDVDSDDTGESLYEIEDLEEKK